MTALSIIYPIEYELDIFGSTTGYKHMYIHGMCMDIVPCTRTPYNMYIKADDTPQTKLISL